MSPLDHGHAVAEEDSTALTVREDTQIYYGSDDDGNDGSNS